jgi:hypothetical protein
MGMKKNTYGILVGNPEEERPLELYVGGIILKWNRERWDGAVWIGFILFWIGTSSGIL